MYHVEHAGKSLALETRTEAVSTAQQLSRDSGGRAIVFDDEGFVRMVYRGGALDSFLYESPVTKSRRA